MRIFFFFFAVLPKNDSAFSDLKWRAWSILYSSYIPHFIKKSERKKYAQQLIEVFNLESMEEFKKRLKERFHFCFKLYSKTLVRSPMTDNDIDRIGSLN